MNFAGKWSWELFARKNTKTSLSLEPDSCGYGYALPACKIIIQSLFFIIVKFQMEMPKTIYACQLRAAMPGLPSSRWSVASEEAWLVIEPFQKCKFGKGHKTSSFVWLHNFCIQLKYSPHMTLMIRRNAYLKIFEMLRLLLLWCHLTRTDVLLLKVTDNLNFGFWGQRDEKRSAQEYEIQIMNTKTCIITSL